MNTNDEIPASNAVDGNQADKPVPDGEPEKTKYIPVATDTKPVESAKKKKTKPEKPKKPRNEPRKGVRFGTVFVWSVLAALFGAAGGTALSYGLMKADKFPVSASSQTDTKAALQVVAELEDDVAALQARLDQPAETETVDLSPITARLDALEARPMVTEDGTVIDPSLSARLDALESAEPAEMPVTDLTAIEDRLTALEAAMSEQSGGTEESAATVSPEVIARIEALEQANEIPAEPVDLLPLQERIDAVDSRAGSLETDITARLEALEARASDLEADAAEALRSAVPIPAFPKTAVLEALSSADAEDQGFFKRAVGKHIKVQNENAIKRVTAIESLVASGEIDAALAQIQNLPQPGQDAAAAWVKNVNDIRSTP